MHNQGSSRRSFLKLGVGGAAVVAFSGGILSWWFSKGYSSQLAVGDKPISLSVKEFAVIRAVVQTLLPEGDGFPSGESLGLAQRFDEEVWAASDSLRSDLKNGIQLFEHGTLLVGYRSRFTELSLSEREACFTAYLTGKNDLLRQVALAFREMSHFFYYVHPEIWPRIGYPGPFVQEPQPPASHLAYLQLLKGQS